jgi:hypothetical protein
MKKFFRLKLDISEIIRIIKQFVQARGDVMVEKIEWTVFVGSISAMFIYFLIAPVIFD